MKKKISILMLTHNAYDYVKETIITLNEVTNSKDLKKCEIIVVDNASDDKTKELLHDLKSKGYIDKLYLSPINTLFAKGNNIAAKLASIDSENLLLLNSDVKIINPNWLNILLKLKNKNDYKIVSYGYCSNKPKRLDGYCFLIDKDIYDKYELDENFEWFWGITKIQSQVLKEYGNILAIKNHNKYVYHYGGKSGKAFINAKGMDVDKEIVYSWFENSNYKVFVKNALNPFFYFTY